MPGQAAPQSLGGISILSSRLKETSHGPPLQTLCYDWLGWANLHFHKLPARLLVPPLEQQVLHPRSPCLPVEVRGAVTSRPGVDSHPPGCLGRNDRPVSEGSACCHAQVLQEYRQGPLCSLGSECVKRGQLLGDRAWQLETHLEPQGCCPPAPRIQNPGLASRQPGRPCLAGTLLGPLAEELLRRSGSSRPDTSWSPRVPLCFFRHVLA